MQDVWASVAQLDHESQERLAEVLETRGADPGQRAMRREFLDAIELSPGARVLEVGCGTGVLTRALAELPAAEAVVGVDLAPSLLQEARRLSEGIPNLTFEEGDASALEFADGAFDAVVFDSTLSHVPDPAQALGEARRVIGEGGTVAAFDGDYATTTVALGGHDPLQRCVDAMMSGSVTDRWLMRRLRPLASAAGFEVQTFRSHGFVDTGESGYMLSVIDRGADLLAASGELSRDTAATLKAEARGRVERGQFFGHIAYVSLIARATAA